MIKLKTEIINKPGMYFKAGSHQNQVSMKTRPFSELIVTLVQTASCTEHFPSM